MGLKKLMDSNKEIPDTKLFLQCLLHPNFPMYSFVYLIYMFDKMEKEHLLYQIFFQKFPSYKRYQDFKGNANNDNCYYQYRNAYADADARHLYHQMTLTVSTPRYLVMETISYKFFYEDEDLRRSWSQGNSWV